MPWYRLHVSVSADLAEAVAAQLQQHGASAVSMENAGDTELFEPAPDETPLWDQTVVSGLFENKFIAEDIIKSLQQDLNLADRPGWREDVLEDLPWERAWMSRYEPMQFGEHLWVCPSWCTPPEPDAVNIMLDPGLAFGSGQHASTTLCLEWLATRDDLDGKTVIDFGCGSGILAIAALKLGAASARGIDHDNQAVRASRDNAANNDVAQRYTALHSEEIETGMEADIVLANILAQPLVELAPRIGAMVRARGQLVLAGMLSEQGDMVAAAYGDAFDFERREKDGWVLLAGTKNPKFD